MQCSFSETFNIVGCDLITEGVPLVGSKEIPWMNKLFAPKNVTSTNDIYFRLLLSYYFPKFNIKSNQRHLNKYTTKTEIIWLNYFS